MLDEQFVDYYEVLEVSPNANSETIERLFRHFAKHLHPDVAHSGDIHKFTQLVEAYEVLKDPKSRAAYDAQRERHVRQNSALVEDAQCVDSDSVQRHKILSLLYAKRRQDMKAPGIASSTLERLVECPEEVMNFHLWYFRENEWIQREESGVLSITAKGVDKIEAIAERQATSADRRLTVEGDKVNGPATERPAPGRATPGRATPGTASDSSNDRTAFANV